MKWNCFIFLYFFVFIGVVTAQKQDNVWLFGYDYNPGGLKEGIRFTFDDSLVIINNPRPMDFAKTSTCISDSSGNLLLYSNGCYISNSEDMDVAGSSGLNPGTMYNIFCTADIGYNTQQGIITLPDPTQTHLFHFFHYLVTGPQSKNVLHSVVDLAQNNGEGLTLFKNIPLVLDTISPDGFHAIKHANGRDWWILAAKQYSNKYYNILLSSDGIKVKEQVIGTPTWSGAGGEMVFSPDGSKLARFNAQDDLRIFDFNRCTGELSNPVFIPITDNADNELFAGLAWSADGHYLYAAEVKRILQFDMWASDIAASKIIVAERATPVTPHMAYLELGPDGYIYGRPLGGQFFMHRIKYLERGGLDSGVQQSYFELEFPFVNLPHFPNFRLGPVDGSPCDTLGLDNHPLAGWRYDKTGGLGVDFTSVSWYEPETWWWDFGDPASGSSNQTSERNPVHTFSAPGAYEVCLTVSNQYGSDTKCRWVWLNTVSTDNPEDRENQIIFYPNPTTGLLQWSGLPEGAVLGLRVHDALGRLCLERENPTDSVDISVLPDGLYHVTLLGANGRILTAKRLVLAKR